MDGLQDHKFNIRLVRAVKKYPVVYNSDLKEYARRDCREMAWIDIAEDLNAEPKAIQKKWQNFRTLLVRNLKQKQMGCNVKKYYLYDYIKFVIPYLKKSYSADAINKTTIKQRTDKRAEEVENEYVTDTDQSAGENENEIIDEDDINNPIYLEEDEITHLSPQKEIKISVSSDDEAEFCEGDDFKNIENEAKPPPAVSQKIAQPTPNAEASNSAVSTQIYSRHSDLENCDNPKRQFVLSLLPDLNEMSNSQMRQFKCKVLLLVDEILKENPT